MKTELEQAPEPGDRVEHPRAREYAERVVRFSADAERHGARSRLVSNLRGVLFAALVGALLYWGFGGNRPLGLALSGLALVFFVVLVTWHSRVIREEDLSLRWVAVNKDAQRRVGSDFRQLSETGEDFKNPLHPYADDLDLFGRGSLFQRLNVAHTEFGQKRLASYLMNRASPDAVRARQAAVRELAPMLAFRQELEALALAVADPLGPSDPRPKKKSRVNTEPLIAWAESKPLLMHKASLVWVARVAPPLTLAWLMYCLSQDWHPLTWLTPLFLQAILLLTAREITTQVFAAVSSSQGVFLRFGPMLQLLESMQPKSALLLDLKQATESAGREPPSVAMRSFERVVSWFELRHNGLIHPLVNGLLLWDIHCVIQLEKWQARSGKHLRAWFQALGELEALSSLAAFTYDNPDYAFPELNDGPACFEASQLGHPLLAFGKRVSNDVTLAEPGRGLLVTGSNMSGKSTLLRAMGINAVLAQTGAPVCAHSLKMSPLAVRTSLRISDSLDEGVSHFYAEIRKLGSVLKALGGEVPVLFLLDEILHGTNSRERQIGARWVLQELIEHGAVGAVSTHDSGLCELPEPLMQRVQQVHLRETVVAEEMTFDYLVRPGPVRSGNALRLMRSLGIGVPLEE
ncbi:MAG: hypothetical protein RJA70_2933 [Pseudomonadota bacterium]